MKNVRYFLNAENLMEAKGIAEKRLSIILKISENDFFGSYASGGNSKFDEVRVIRNWVEEEDCEFDARFPKDGFILDLYVKDPSVLEGDEILHGLD